MADLTWYLIFLVRDPLQTKLTSSSGSLHLLVVLFPLSYRVLNLFSVADRACLQYMYLKRYPIASFRHDFWIIHIL